MSKRVKMALTCGAVLVLSACAAPMLSDGDWQGQDAARGAQTMPDQTGVTVSGSARVGVTRTWN
jgi:hypothetical protein